MKLTFEKNNVLWMVALIVLGSVIVGPTIAWFIVTDPECEGWCYGEWYGDAGYGYGYGYGNTTPNPYADPNYGYGYTSWVVLSSSSSSSSSTSNGWWGWGWLWWSTLKDYCPSGDYSPSIYDKQCGTAPSSTSDTRGDSIVARLTLLVDRAIAGARGCQSCSENYEEGMESVSMLQSSYESFLNTLASYRAGRATKEQVLSSFRDFATHYYNVKTFGKVCKKTCDL